jgi:type II secretory pathway component PulF
MNATIFLVMFKIILLPSSDAQFQNQTSSVNFLQGFMTELIALLSKDTSNIAIFLMFLITFMLFLLLINLDKWISDRKYQRV